MSQQKYSVPHKAFKHSIVSKALENKGLKRKRHEKSAARLLAKAFPTLAKYDPQADTRFALNLNQKKIFAA